MLWWKKNQGVVLLSPTNVAIWTTKKKEKEEGKQNCKSANAEHSFGTKVCFRALNRSGFGLQPHYPNLKFQYS